MVTSHAPLRMLLGDENARRFVPKGLLKQNDKGAYINGIKMVVVLSGSIILAQLNKLNSVCMPLRYIWVFVACILLKKAGDRFGQEYKFTKGKVLGAWCLFVTLACCVFGKYSEGPSP